MSPGTGLGEFQHLDLAARYRLDDLLHLASFAVTSSMFVRAGGGGAFPSAERVSSSCPTAMRDHDVVMRTGKGPSARHVSTGARSARPKP